MPQSFPLGDVLSVTTGRLVSRDHIAGVYRILGYMTGEELNIHQLPRASDECKPALLVQHPQLRDIDVPEHFIDKDHVYAWLTVQENTFGAELEIDPLILKQGDYSDPIGELCDRIGPEKVWVVKADELGEG